MGECGFCFRNTSLRFRIGEPGKNGAAFDPVAVICVDFNQSAARFETDVRDDPRFNGPEAEDLNGDVLLYGGHGNGEWTGADIGGRCRTYCDQRENDQT